MMNKPRVDRIEIVNKCKTPFVDKFPCEARVFGFKQIIDFGVSQILEAQDRHYSGQAGHKKPRKKIHYHEPTDLDCDDPLYDGQPVF